MMKTKLWKCQLVTLIMPVIRIQSQKFLLMRKKSLLKNQGQMDRTDNYPIVMKRKRRK